MRSFIAIKIPAALKDSLAKLQAKLKSTGADVKWVEPANIHLTLKFLGEITQEMAIKISQIIKDSAKNRAKFEVSLKDLGAFPKIDSPKVIWVGIDKGKQEIEAIALELEQKLNAIGLPKEERPFTCHLTIGRIKTGRNIANLIKELAAQKENCKQNIREEFYVEAITFYKSILTGSAAVYETLTEENLQS